MTYKKEKQIRVGILGLGTVGKAVVEKILKDRKRIREETKIDIKILAVCDKVQKKRKLFPSIKFFKNASDVLEKKPDILVELTGSKSAYGRIKAALKNNINVVTADKFVISQHGRELEKIANLKKAKLRFSGSCGGGMNLINSLQFRKGDKIASLIGILNGTTNYILTRMHESLDYEKALKEAKEKGFAEPNPEFDISGKDAACKLAILSSIGFSTFIKPEKIYVKGIKNMTKEDIEYAKELGYVIKLLAVSKKSKSSLELFVEPCLLPKNNQLTKVSYERNALFIKGDTNLLIEGEGAGAKPTSAVVVSDIINMARIQDVNYFGENTFEMKDPTKTETRYLIRFKATDKPGVLAKISKAFGRNKISIQEVIQLAKAKSKERVPVILTTHKEGTTFERLEKALSEIPKEVAKTESVLRIED